MQTNQTYLSWKKKNKKNKEQTFSVLWEVIKTLLEGTKRSFGQESHAEQKKKRWNKRKLWFKPRNDDISSYQFVGGNGGFQYKPKMKKKRIICRLVDGNHRLFSMFVTRHSEKGLSMHSHVNVLWIMLFHNIATGIIVDIWLLLDCWHNSFFQ